jgi:hypothetical protein
LVNRIQIFVPDVEPHPRSVTDILTSVAGMRGIEIDEGIWEAVSKHTIAGTGVAVTHNFVGPQSLKAQRGVVNSAKETRGLLELVCGKTPELWRHVTRNEFQDLASG